MVEAKRTEIPTSAPTETKPTKKRDQPSQEPVLVAPVVRRNKAGALLRGLVRCGRCGGLMIHSFLGDGWRGG